MSEPVRLTADRWESILESIDLEIVQLAIICRVRLLDPGVVERVLKGDELVCGSRNASAFSKLRSLVMMHFNSREHIDQTLGVDQGERIAAHIREHLRGRVGDQIGGTTAAG